MCIQAVIAQTNFLVFFQYEHRGCGAIFYNQISRLKDKEKGGRVKILIVDDSKTNLLMTVAYLEKMGHQAVATNNPFDCVKLFEAEKPDLVILDVVMDGMDGYECAKAIRKINDADANWVPIIFLSGRIDDESIASGIEAGGDDYLTKPFSEITLAAKIKAMQRIAAMRSKLFNATQQLQVANEKLNEISLTDGLTQIPNRRAFDEKLASEWQRACRLGGEHSVISVVMLDIDNFKKFNDFFGHQVGDECLQVVAKALKEALKRTQDSVYRYGGEEFVAILPHLEIEGAMQVAQAMRSNVEKKKIKHAQDNEAEYVTISLGVATIMANKEINPDSVVKQADEALYRAKKLGRNRVEAAKGE